MTDPATSSPIATLADAKAWLGTLAAGGSAQIGSAQFAPAIVKQVFSLLPGSDPLALTAIAVDPAAATLSGTATVVGEAGCTAAFAFTGDGDDPLLLGLTVTLPADRPWAPLPNFNFEFRGLVASFVPDPAVGAAVLELDCKLHVANEDLDAVLTLPAIADADWTLAVTGTPSPSEDMLTALAGGTNPLSVIANGFSLEHFSLGQFEMAFSPTKGSCSLLRLGLDYTSDWPLFGGAFTITGFGFDFTGYAPFGSGDFQALATARTKIGTVPVDVAVQFPDPAVFAHLDSSYQLPVATVFTGFGIKLPANFPDIEISTLSFALYVEQSSIDFSLGIDKPVTIAGNVALDRFHVDLGIGYAAGKFTGHGDLLAHFTIGTGATPTTVELTGSYDSSGALALVGKAGNLEIGDLIDTMLAKFGVDRALIPQPVSELVLDSLTMSFTRTGGEGGTDTFSFDCQGHTVVAGVKVAFAPSVTLTYNEGTKAWGVDFSGTLTLTKADKSTMVFAVHFSKTGADTFILASYSSDDPVEFGDIAGIFGFSLPTIPSGFDLDLTKVALRYDFKSGDLFFGAVSNNPHYGKVSYVSVGPPPPPPPPQSQSQSRELAVTASAGRQNVVILAANSGISLSQLPLVGADLARIGEVSLDSLKVAIAYPAPVAKDAVAGLNQAIAEAGSDYPTIPVDGLEEPILLSAQLTISSDQPRPVSLSLGGTPTPPPPPSPAAIRIEASDASSDGGGTTKWFPIQKSFGPVSIQKIGLRYSDSTLWALMNAGLEAGPVDFGLIGLGVGSPLTSFSPKFTVEGITLSIVAGPMSFSGALVGSLDPVNLYGELALTVPAFSIGALGGYAEYQGDPSCFLYAVLDAEIGGPPFFFVTGLAAGFGLNRSLVIPDVGSLGTFPLIQWSTGSGPSSTGGGDVGSQVEQAMTTLADSGVIAPSIGEYWVAVGIKFTSFKLLDSFALLTVKAGNEVEVDLLGLSTLTLPPEDPSPLAVAQLALEASFSPAHHLIAVSGQLTPKSYVLSSDCHLTGGFAFYMWYGGDYAGEFVLSLGGYSPRFKKPGYYPDVPRLGLNWQVTDNLSIAGDEYFALTPSAAMAGGGLKAVWSSGDISAWFAVEADFLVLFKPLHYYISASIDLGASVKIDLWFTSFTITIHLGVDAEFWGPPFSARVHVDLDIVSFTISYEPGGSDPPPPLTWDQFVTQVLPSRTTTPAPQPRRSARLAGVADETPGDSGPAPLVQVNAATGILKTLPPVPDAPIPLDWVVDPETLVLNVTSTVPVTATALVGAGNVILEKDPNDHAQPTKDIAVAATQTGVGGLTSTLTITVTSDEDVTIYATQAVGAVPKAVWENRPLVNGVPQGVDPLNDTVISNALTGMTLTPMVPVPDHTLPIPLDRLQYTTDDKLALAWSAPVVADDDPFSDETVHATIQDPTAVANRSAIISAINRIRYPLGNPIAPFAFAVNPAPDVAALADPASGSLLAPPMLRYLVEAR
jgi:hypothetical protein